MFVSDGLSSTWWHPDEHDTMNNTFTWVNWPVKFVFLVVFSRTICLLFLFALGLQKLQGSPVFTSFPPCYSVCECCLCPSVQFKSPIFHSFDIYIALLDEVQKGSWLMGVNSFFSSSFLCHIECLSQTQNVIDLNFIHS